MEDRSGREGKGGKMERKKKRSAASIIKLSRATPHGATQPCQVLMWQVGRAKSYGATLQEVAPRAVA